MSRYTSKGHSLLKDSSWIRKTDDEDEDVDRDPNYAKSVLSHYRSNEDLVSPDTEVVTTTKSVRTSTSVSDLTKRFSGSQDELRTSTLPSTRTTSSYTKSGYSSLKSDSPKTSTTTTVTKDGVTETTTITSSSQMSPTKFTERVRSSSKGAQYSTYSPTRTKVTETTVISSKDAEDKLYDTLIPSAIKDDLTDRKSTVNTTVKTVRDVHAEEKLITTLIPDSKSSVTTTETVTLRSSGDGHSYVTERKNYSSYSIPDSSYEYTSVTSPTSTTYTTSSSSYRTNSRSDGILSDYSRSTNKSVYLPERTVHERDMCSTCRKPFIGEAKMILDDMNINCHASCFKCDVCNSTLGHMKAGDSIWVYRRMVHCENCFEVTRDKWRR